jgi:Bacterial extracellular solute-binding proteins, family 5 Middle
MTHSPFLSGLSVVSLMFLAACASSPVEGPARLLPAPCIALSPESYDAGTVSVAISRPGAISHMSSSPDRIDRLLAGQLYETLIRVDCAGIIRPGLATAWKATDSGKVWSFTLRKDAFFWDGRPVTARDVLESWNRSGGPDTVIVSTREEGERKLSVYFRRAYSEVPAVLASYKYSVTGPLDANGFMIGTGAYRIVSSSDGKVSTAQVSVTTGRPPIEFVDRARADERDLLENEIDLLISRDPSVVEYARRRPNLVSVNLPWDRMYVLISTSRVPALEPEASFLPLPPVFPDELFIDAVRGDVRASRLPLWWNDTGSCGAIMPNPTGRTRPLYTPDGQPRILYEASDDAARQIAERVVALSTMDVTDSQAVQSFIEAVPGMTEASGRLIAAGTDSEEFAASLRNGSDYGYIFPVSRRPYDACTQTVALAGRARWLVQPGSEFWNAAIPLVDTRPRAIVVRNRLGLRIDWFGNVHILTEPGAR